MPSFYVLSKAVAAAAMLVLAGADPIALPFQQSIDDLTSAWRRTTQKPFLTPGDYQASDRVIEPTTNTWQGGLPPASGAEKHYADGILTAVSHPVFPEYAVRYKFPEICDPSVRQISGYLDIEQDKHFFFWFFESRNNPREDPVILWLNGGPACSSMTGLLTELGPCMVNEQGDGTVLNEHSWNSNASIIFLDQPLNVGFSYGEGSALTSAAAAKHVYAFLQMFFSEFPEYASLDFHVAGESYGGHYVPAIGGEIHRNNKVIESLINGGDLNIYVPELSTISLKSLMIGNGNTDPLIQFKYYPMMACNNSYGPTLDQATCDRMSDAYPACAALIEKCYATGSILACMPAVLKCNEDLTVPYASKAGKSMYDVRKNCTNVETSCIEATEAMSKYLNRPEVMQAIGAEVNTYESCNNDLFLPFGVRDWMRPLMEEIPPLLEDNIRVLVYAGDADFVCNWMGNKAWTIELPWSGHDEFLIAKDTDWFSTTANEHAGELRRTEDGRFAFLRVYDSGHMVPMDHGDYAIDMLNGWLQGKLA